MADSSFLTHYTEGELKELLASWKNTVLTLSVRQSYSVGDKQLVAAQLREATEMVRAVGDELVKRTAIADGETPRTTRAFYPDFSGANPS